MYSTVVYVLLHVYVHVQVYMYMYNHAQFYFAYVHNFYTLFRACTITHLNFDWSTLALYTIVYM